MVTFADDKPVAPKATDEFVKTEHPFFIGDVVQLNSGGPPMTVRRIAEPPTGLIQCTWWGDDFKIQENYFDYRTIKYMVGSKPKTAS